MEEGRKARKMGHRKNTWNKKVMTEEEEKKQEINRIKKGELREGKDGD